MANERAILCGSVSDGSLPFKDLRPLRLRMWGPQRNVHLTIQDVRLAVLKAVPPVFLDLIDIAVYVYCADQAVTRGGNGVLDLGKNWRRRFFFRIPVRMPQVWKDRSVLSQLVATLSFLSEDEYHFDFEHLANDPSFERYLEFSSTPYDGIVEEVAMFSGGIDSLAGAVQKSVIEKRKVLLVHHRSTGKLVRRYRYLLELLNEQAKDFRPLHLPVRINRAKNLGGEYTQRTRSFLYVSLGATLATILGLNRLQFYENGIVSLNLPPSPQVVGARATRTTHPQVLKGFSNLITSLAGKAFTVENPFLWKTKTEVVRLIADAGCGNLLKYTTSCTQTREATKQHPHCGVCSQCIDRRFAVLAGGQEENDPGEAYKVDLLIGERKEGNPRTMLAAFLETANEIEKMDALQFFSRFGEASRVLRHIEGTPDATAMRIFDLHRRHAKQVTGVIDQAIAQYGPAIRKRELPTSCLLRLVYESGSAAGGASAAAITTAPQPPCSAKNYICRKGKCWVIRFDGQEEKVYTADTGFHYLQILLEHPGTQFSASELACIVSRRTKELRMRTVSLDDFAEENPPVGDGLGADDMLDKDGGEDYTTRLAEINELLSSLRESDSPTRLDDIEELENQKQWITSTLSSTRGLRGRKRLLGDGRNRVRNRVCNAIRRALKQVLQYDPRLGEHLVKPVLNLGHTISYVPREGMSWSTSVD